MTEEAAVATVAAAVEAHAAESAETETEMVEVAVKKVKGPKPFTVTENDEIQLTPFQKLVQLAQEKALLVYRRSAKEGTATRSAFFKVLAQGSNPADAAIDAMIVDTLTFNTDADGGEVWTDAEDIRANFIRVFVKGEMPATPPVTEG
jgi:Rieske Fe-S protein